MSVEVFIWNNINFLNVFVQTIKLHKDAKKTKTLFEKKKEICRIKITAFIGSF